MTMTPVLDILRNATGSCDFPHLREIAGSAEWWETIIREKSSDSGFDDLVVSILERGWHPDSKIGWREHNGYINEGHHRLVAAILLCLDEVPTSPSGEDWCKDPHGFTEVVNAHHDDWEDPIDYLMG